MSEKVLYADAEVTVHIPFSKADSNGFIPVESKTLLPGQFVALADLPPYQQEAAKQGKIPGARILDEKDANLLNNNGPESEPEEVVEEAPAEVSTEPEAETSVEEVVEEKPEVRKPSSAKK